MASRRLIMFDLFKLANAVIIESPDSLHPAEREFFSHFHRKRVMIRSPREIEIKKYSKTRPTPCAVFVMSMNRQKTRFMRLYCKAYLQTSLFIRCICDAASYIHPEDKPGNEAFDQFLASLIEPFTASTLID